jgi:ABC-2 type transport system ATP-binding protein
MALLGAHGRCAERDGGAIVVRTPEGARAIAPVIRSLDEAGIEVDAVEIEEPTLDDVFLAVTGHTASESEVEAGAGTGA